MKTIVSGWCVNIVDAHYSPVAFCVRPEGHVLVSEHVLSVITCAKTNACRGVRFPCPARDRCLFYLRARGEGRCSAWRMHHASLRNR